MNARLSERSARGYGRIAGLARQGLQSLSAVAAQTEQDAERLRQLGATEVTVCGNLKFDVEPPENTLARGLALRSLLGESRPVFLAASTRDGEEALILDAVERLAVPHLLTVIVPRHPQRFDEVAALLGKRGLNYARKSVIAAADTPVGDTCTVVLGDTMGEMFAYYAACDVALIGGSLLPFGGQNLIEACSMQKPVIIGPHTFNFDWVAREAVNSGGARRVSTAGDLVDTLNELFMSSETRQAMGSAAYRFSQGAGGANRRILELIGRFLPHG